MARVSEERLAQYRKLDREAFDFAEPAVAAFFQRAAEQGQNVEIVVHPGGEHGWATMVFDLWQFADWFDEHLIRGDRDARLPAASEMDTTN